MDDEVHVGVRVDVGHGRRRLVVPALRVAHDGKAHRVAPGAGGLDALHRARVDVALALHVRVVGVNLEHVAARQQQGCREN